MVVFDAFTALKNVLQLKKQTADIDTVVAKLHYKATAAILFTGTLLVTSYSLLGNPINCAHGNLQENVVNTYCWIHSTFTLPKYLHNEYSPHPGIGLSTDEDEKIYHAYYQWVPFFLCFMALMFRIPRYLWKNSDAGKIKGLVKDLSFPEIPEKDRSIRINRLRDYIQMNLHQHNLYATIFLFSEHLNFINIIFNFFLTNSFLNYSFINYGYNVVEFYRTDKNGTNPMIELFPRVTKCTFEKFGVSGSTEVHDLLCILAVNVFNDKIFLFIWFYFKILLALTLISCVYIICIICIPKSRSYVFQRRLNFGHNVLLDKFIMKLQYGDFCLLYLLSKNLDELTYRNLIIELIELPGRKDVEPDGEQRPMLKLQNGDRPRERLRMPENSV